MRRLLPVLILLLAACSSPKFDARAERSFAAAPTSPNVVVESRNGAITLEVDPGRSDVDVVATFRATGSTQAEADERLAGASVRIEERSDHLRIEPTFPGGWRSSDAVSLRIAVPAAADIHLHTSNGAITASAITGTATVDSSNGSLTLTDVSGPIDARTSNGRIEIRDARGSVKASSSNGAITIEGAGGPVEATTSNGRLNLLDVSGPVTATSSNGAAEITLRPGFAGTLEVSTANGRVIVEGQTGATRTEVERGKARLEFPTAGKTSRVSTSNGNATVKGAG